MFVPFFAACILPKMLSTSTARFLMSASLLIAAPDGKKIIYAPELKPVAGVKEKTDTAFLQAIAEIVNRLFSWFPGWRFFGE